MYNYNSKGLTKLKYVDIKTLVEKHNLTSVEATLAKLKQHYPDFFKNYIMQYHSRSMQPATFLYPRVLLVGADAELIITYNGLEGHESYNKLEIMESVYGGLYFNFFEIAFPSKNKPAQFSNPNPQVCLTCHQSYYRTDIDPRPNWEPYSFWPGTYFSSGKFPFNKNNIKYDERFKRPEDQQIVTDHLSEKDNLAYFEKYIKPYNFRYRLLEKFNTDFPTIFTELIISQSYRRMIRLAMATPFFKFYKYAFYSAARCQHIPWPQEFEDWHTNNMPLEEYIRDYRNPAAPEAPNFGTPAGLPEGYILPPPVPPKFQKRAVSKSIALIFEPLGVSTIDWSTDFRTEGGRFAFRERFGIPSNPYAAIRELIKEMMPEMKKLSCDDLEEKSFAALSGFLQDNPGLDIVKENLELTVSQYNTPAQQICAQCHENTHYVSAPKIPFSNPELLFNHINTKEYPKGDLVDEVTYRTGGQAQFGEQMPPHMELSKTQRENLIMYLEEVKTAN